ncbi:XkdF-like putative serine protease domain-containing protein [Pedobacter sp. MR2016-24]|uniref:XkdF-like putative serine protease domain-containing protein n=1 Tax=Pedobacter sp. MR2016-24 TaxID=2994466 RepID=UPI002247BF6D|nr:XkdF-like putative serine protease domain-containing protein [Pedobacter sp. MR2016-24]MCX2486603.1 XkdF-like putative serine protease domain-containing protein [Pedobacter sp. MR2016-24]
MEKTYNNLPLYKLNINVEDNAFVDAIGIVDEPAIASNALFFGKVTPDENIVLEVKESATKQMFSDSNKYELLGAAMIPDLPMFRPKNELIPHDHYVLFTADEIRHIAKVFHAKGCQNNINLQHTSTTADSFTFQSYFIDKSRNIGTPEGIETLPEGTWMVGMSVANQDTFNKLTKSNFGFSVEGLFGYSSFSKVMEKTPLELLEEQLQFLQSIK